MYASNNNESPCKSAKSKAEDATPSLSPNYKLKRYITRAGRIDSFELSEEINKYSN